MIHLIKNVTPLREDDNAPPYPPPIKKQQKKTKKKSKTKTNKQKNPLRLRASVPTARTDSELRHNYFIFTVLNKIPIYFLANIMLLSQYVLKAGLLGHAKCHQTYDMIRTLVGNKIGDHSDLVGASPVDAAPTPSSSRLTTRFQWIGQR